MNSRCSEWPRVPIKDVYHGLFDGPHATPPIADDGPIFLGIGNVTDDGHLDQSAIRHISEADFPKWTKRVTPQAGDIVFTYEATLNRYAMIPEGFRGCLGRRMALIRPNREIIEPRFLFYCFFGHEWRETVAANILSGATVDRIPLTSFPDFPIPLPRLPIQRRIASILSAYDHLIENNTRRIAILEEMVRRLYEEWFVRFRFPGHEKMKFDDGLPRGWGLRSISDVSAYLSRGLAPKYADDGPSLIVNQKCIRHQQLNLNFARRQEKNVPADKSVRFGDVLINSTGVGTLGRVAQVYTELENVTADTHVTIVRPCEMIATDYFGLSMLQLESYFEDQGVGSTGQTELSRTRIGETNIVVPPMQIQKTFGHVVAPMRRLCISLTAKNTNLRGQRDLLLPKLVSGEIDVSEAENKAIAVESNSFLDKSEAVRP